MRRLIIRYSTLACFEIPTAALITVPVPTSGVSDYIYQPPADTGLDILYRDDSLLALNKPSGLLSVPGRGKARQDSLASRLAVQYPQASVVHRLDMDTSGILLFACSARAQRQLGQLFERRQIQKRYLAIIAGQPVQATGCIDLPLIADWPNRPRQIVDHNTGKPARTYYEVVDYDPQQDASRIILKPETGRSHQLRVHMQAIGHPILGDTLYADDAIRNRAKRLMLHAEQLCFQHPQTGIELEISCPAPF